MRASRRQLRIFAKGNVDVKDSLLWSRVNGVVEWNGLNELLRTRHPNVLAKIKHETCTRLDLIPLPGEASRDRRLTWRVGFRRARTP